ncbi:MAG: hypothetical protein NC913_08885, partial [Candidatus Omnitrophica bacterium]|nr:hypothetical protein [Candidatus Omnitrophota bacterium]
FDGNKRVVIITSDLLYFPKSLVNNLKTEISKRFQMKFSDIFITASHTHTGPFLDERLCFGEKPLPDYTSILEKEIIGGVISSINDEEDVTIGYAAKDNVDIGIINRRKKTEKGIEMLPNPEGKVDKNLCVLSFEKVKGNPKVILLNYSCHPTTLSTSIYEISADYPGVVQREIENYYSGSICMFTNGCCGDVRPGIIENGRFTGGNFNDIERMGKILFGNVVELVEKTNLLNDFGILSFSENFHFPLNPEFIPENEKRLKDIIKIYEEKFGYHVPDEWKNFMNKELKEKKEIPDYVEGEIQIIKIGDVFLVGIPGEAMVEIGLRIRKHSKNKKLFICGYANGSIGYIPTRQAVIEGGYETTSFLYYLYPAPFSQNMESQLERYILSRLK